MPTSEFDLLVTAVATRLMAMPQDAHGPPAVAAPDRPLTVPAADRAGRTTRGGAAMDVDAAVTALLNNPDAVALLSRIVGVRTPPAQDDFPVQEIAI